MNSSRAVPVPNCLYRNPAKRFIVRGSSFVASSHETVPVTTKRTIRHQWASAKDEEVRRNDDYCAEF
jgi:hypothetical protein